ncbi:glycosyltransferase family 2 protein [Patescibacteria group bacterium]|nr:glycosyltransferase family 2 protein [Patescibacteria group bacterium]
MKTSAIIIAKNAGGLIEDCLQSVGWVDEIILVDTGSTDETVEIAKRLGVKVVETKDGDFSKWRNLGAKSAKSDWLFYIDSDERVTEELREEIKRTILEGTDAAYAIPRRNFLLGHEMHWGGWWPDYVLRLIRKDALIGWEGDLHEQPKIEGNVGKLKNPFVHITHRSLSEMVEKTNNWSEIEARLLFKSHHPKMTWWRFFSVASREFWYRGVLKLGFLDGPIGIIEIIYQMYSRMITYAKLWEMQIEK